MQIVEFIIFPLLSLAVLFIITKLMGYRQVSQLNMYDYINGITIGSIASELAIGEFDDFLQPLIAMLIYGILIILLSKLTRNSLKIRKLIDGQAVVLYENDKIYYQELKKAKLDLDEFLMQCRIAGYFKLKELALVILETNGRLSFYPKQQYQQVTAEDLNLKITPIELPSLLIKEGKIIYENLNLINRDTQWLERELVVLGVKINDVLLMYQEDNSNLIIYTVNDIERKYI
ncbi:DUF421 domain-containing protein [Erysipelatoclostridium sp. An15]|uniref:DUF421 domain-containing protein n=1 Tax=Erysipelatoclostridium sp. An15 TaxID=1965566 RepID=UPI000B392BFD|nr:YetF domain-containing protein [Erysipelatoclostridium sp. An15]OUQ05611.1 DUF421 domain-containing protein [Erysipelatoclostridium sp. An15]